jgi:Carbohydrate family 9 binding domain-like/F5/8 type C domain
MEKKMRNAIRNLYSCLVLAGISFILFASNEVSAKEITAIKATEKIKIDGKLSEKIWKSALKHKDFSILRNASKEAPVKTTFGVLFDDDAIYLGIVCSEPDMANIKAKCKVHDGGVWRDECIEIFLNPEGDLYDYFHFGINPLGASYDAWAYDGGQIFNVNWNPKGLKVASSRSKKSWTIELKIPFNQLGLGPNVKKDSWRFNIVRTRHIGSSQYFTFSPISSGGNHQPQLFSKINMDVGVSKFRWEIGTPVVSNLSQKGSSLKSDIELYVKNQTGKFRFFELQTVLTGPSGKQTKYSITKCLDSNQKQGFKIPVQTSESGKHHIEFTVKDTSTKARLNITAFPLLLEYSPLKVSLEDPYYRQAIFASQQPFNKLKVRVRFQISSSILKGGRFKLTLLNQKGKPLASKDFAKIAKTNNIFPLKIPTLSPGKYIVQANLIAENEKSFVGKTKLTVYPHAAREVIVDANKVLRVNGKPFMPIGFYNVGINELELAQKMGVNTTIDYGFQLPAKALIKRLDKYHKYGIMATGFPYPPKHSASDGNIGLSPLTKAAKLAMRKRMEAVSDHPALLAWYILDEPNRSRYIPQYVEDVYELLKATSPFCPVFISHNNLKSMELFAGIGGDIDCSHPYTLFLKGGGFSKPLTRISKFLDHQEKISKGKRLKWICPQGFSWYDNGIDGNRPPDFKELRVSAYLAAIHGAKGFMWYIWPSQFSYPEMRIGFPHLIKELKTLQAAILSPKQLKVKAISPKSPVHVSAKISNGKTFIFAVNTSDKKLTEKISISGSKITELQVLSEARTVAMNKNIFSDKFLPYATHIYTNDKNIGTKLISIKGINKEIAKEKRRIAKPGNLAHHSQGSTISASPATVKNMKFLYKHVIDGYLTSYGWSPKLSPTLYWLEIKLAKKQKLDKVIIYGSGLLDYDLQYMKNGEWITIKKVKNESSMPSEHNFSPVISDKIRVLVHRVKTHGYNGRHNAHVREIEIYGPKK